MYRCSRIALALFVAGAASAPGWAGEDQEAQGEQDKVRAAITALDADNYYVRQRAAQWLRDQGTVVIPALQEAASGDRLEVTCLAIQVLRDLSASRDVATADAAGDALEELAGAGFTSSSQRAAIALRFHAEARSKRALEEIQRLGGLLDQGDDFQGVSEPRLMIGKKWIGGDDGLANLKWLSSPGKLSIRGAGITDKAIPHLKELSYLTTLELYGTRISEAGSAELQEALPRAYIDYRGGALLGIKGRLNNGCAVDFVKPQSAADAAGLEIGDVIVEFDGQPVDSFKSLTDLIKKHAGGDKVEIKFLRDQEERTVIATLGEWE